MTDAEQTIHTAAARALDACGCRHVTLYTPSLTARLRLDETGTVVVLDDDREPRRGMTVTEAARELRQEYKHTNHFVG